MQAAAPAGLLAAALADGADLHPVVHQATGMVAAQLGGRSRRGPGPAQGVRLRERPGARRGRHGTCWPGRCDSRRRTSDERIDDDRTVTAPTVVPSGRGSCGRASTVDEATARPDGDPMPRQAMLVRALVELADTLVADFDVVELLTLLTDRSRRGARRRGRRPDADRPSTASCASWRRRATPCACSSCSSCRPRRARASTATARGRPIVNHDLERRDERWPRFAVEASDAGFRMVHALPMRLRGTVLGALNLFHVEPGTMSQRRPRRRPGPRRRRHDRPAAAPRRPRGPASSTSSSTRR